MCGFDEIAHDERKILSVKMVLSKSHKVEFRVGRKFRGETEHVEKYPREKPLCVAKENHHPLFLMPLFRSSLYLLPSLWPTQFSL